MKIALIYFSGTGNTAMLTEMLKKHMDALGAKVEIINADAWIGGGTAPDLTDFDYVGIGYPIHAFSVPLPFLRCLKQLPQSRGQRVFIYKTAGEPFPPNRASSLRLIRILKKMGYLIVFERHFLMPYNIVFRYPDSLVKQMVLTNEKLSQGMAKQILSGKTEYIQAGLFPRIICGWTRFLENYGIMLNGVFFHANRHKCTRCMRCIQDCPVNNIKQKKSRIRFGWRCMLCMRCVMGCPEGAITIGILSGWILRGYYDFQRILNDDSISETYVNAHTRGYFRAFQKYYRWAAERIKEETGA